MIVPFIPAPQCGRQKYGNVPFVVNVCLYVAPLFDRGAFAQFVSFGEQNMLSAVQLAPLSTS